MRVTRLILSLLFIFVSAPRLSSQQSITAPQRDPQALTILNQALAASGGATSVASIQDFTATGSITYFWAGSEVQGVATIKARGATNFRVDASLPQGTRSWVSNSAKGSVKEADGQVSAIPPHNAIHLGALSFPQLKIAAVLNNPALSIQYAGSAQVGVRQVNVVHAQLRLDSTSDPDGSVSPLSAMDFLIDTATSQVVSIRDAFHPAGDSMQDVTHEIAFADYRSVNGCLVPFSVTETVGGQETWSIELSTITFNTGLTNADFQL